MTLEQKRLLEPFGKILGAWDQQMMSLPDDELERLEKACSVASVSNCWCYSFSAAGLLLPMIRSAKYIRKLGRRTA
jgi:hypothetical protein